MAKESLEEEKNIKNAKAEQWEEAFTDTKNLTKELHHWVLRNSANFPCFVFTKSRLP